MKVLLASPSMGTGGAERVVAMLARGLVSRGCQVLVVAPPGERDEDLRGLPHERVVVADRGRAMVPLAGSVVRLARVLAVARPDVIHAQNPRYAALMGAARALARGGARPGLLATLHGVAPEEYRRAAMLLRNADHVACVSAAVLEAVISAGLPSGRASLIPNAVEPAPQLEAGARAELDRELGLDGAPVVAIVGRLVAQKAHERFVAAAGVLARSRPDVRFLVVGDGPRRVEIEALAEAAGLGERVLFTGARPDARKLIARAELVVFSSDWEGLSITALESLAAGTPVVSTDVQGMRELLAGGAGAIVPLEGGAALGACMASLLADEPRRLAMGRAGRELVAREHSLEPMIDRHLALYERLAPR